MLKLKNGNIRLWKIKEHKFRKRLHNNRKRHKNLNRVPVFLLACKGFMPSLLFLAEVNGDLVLIDINFELWKQKLHSDVAKNRLILQVCDRKACMRALTVLAL